MTRPRVSAGDVPRARTSEVNSGKPPPSKRFTFSLQFWTETDCFGLGETEAKWFVSLLSRLRELGRENVSRITEDIGFKSTMRCHEIDWDARGMPISEDEFYGLLPPGVRGNREEFPIVQLAVSKGLGRVHGYWDNDWCFQVVLLDPLHNLQPSKTVDYRVRESTVATCELTELLAKLDAVRSENCTAQACGVAAAVSGVIDSQLERRAVVIAALTPEMRTRLKNLCDRVPASFADVIEAGLGAFEGT